MHEMACSAPGVCALESSSLVSCTCMYFNEVAFSHFQIPDPFPIPTFRERTEANLSQRKLADDDRKYMVRVLGTLLCTFVQRTTMKNCRTVAASLVRKQAFLKESVSVHTATNFNVWLCFNANRTLGHNFSISAAKT